MLAPANPGASMPITTCVFDAYGTLFDVAAAAREAAAEPGNETFAEHWVELAKTWRLKQLQYTWLRAAAGVHQDFWSVTQDGLDYALEEQGLDDPALRQRLLDLYWQPLGLSGGARHAARAEGGGQGDGDPVERHAGHAGRRRRGGRHRRRAGRLPLGAVGRRLQAGPAVYALVGEHFGCPAGEVLFVSSNCWDACAGAGYGFALGLGNRAGEPMDRLPWRPAHIVLGDLKPHPGAARMTDAP